VATLSPEQIAQQMRNAAKAGNAPLALRLSQMYKDATRDQPGPQETSPMSPTNIAGAAVEPMAALASGAAARIPAGLAGIGAGVGSLFDEKIDPAGVVRSIQEALAYEPRTQGGKTATEALSFPGRMLEEHVEKPLAERAARLHGPAAGAFEQTGFELLATVLGGRAGAKAAETPGVLKPPVGPSADVRQLASEGVTMTPGQRRGGLPNAIEEKAGAILPPVKTARAKAVQQWDVGQLNKLLKVAGGQPVPKGVSGRAANAHAYAELQKRYKEVLEKMHGDLRSGGDQSLGAELARLKENIDKAVDMNDQQKAIAKGVIDNEIIAKFTPPVATQRGPGTFTTDWELQHQEPGHVGGRANGEVMQQVIEKLRLVENEYKRGDPGQRAVARAITESRQAMFRMLRRENPDMAPLFDDVREGYARYKTSEMASNASAVKGGHYTPGQRLQAIRRRDTSKDRGKFARGEAFEQEDAEAAQRVLGNTQPDSGTPMGMALLEALLGGPAYAMGHPGAAAGLAATPALYSQPVLRWLQERALRPPTPPVAMPAAFGAGMASPPSQLDVDRALRAASGQ
jgi:hypothetical protein